MSPRSTFSEDGMIASAHPLASKCGARILSNGGNVIDAAIATSAALCVVENNSCGLGGDTFVLFKIDGKVKEINGSGRAAKAATTDYYARLGLAEIPSKGPLSCITVPGIVHAWGELLKYATMDLADLIAPAIDIAENGYPVGRKFVESVQGSARSLQVYQGWKDLFIPNGIFPETGYVLKQHDLANSLKIIGREGISSFYEGNLAEQIVRGIKDAGGLLDFEDFRKHTSTLKDPISTDYRGTKIYETSPNSQAATVLLWLNILENVDIPEISEAQIQRLLVETCLKAYQQRAQSIADPTVFPLSTQFLSKEYARGLLHAGKDFDRNTVPSTTEGDTTYFAVGDREGNAVSMIQSNYMGFGSGIIPEGTGLVLQNRGCYFSLEKSHHNALAPGKRTFHTLCASLGERDQNTLFCLGTMGGDIQPQIHVQLLVKILDLRMEVQDAVNSPRWFIPGTIYESQDTIYFEEGLQPPSKLPENLRIEQVSGLTSQAGHANAIHFASGGLLGAADPRCDGSAVGI